ncbi:DUF3168 domain-containing protein [Xanthobacter sp.]|uniref:DUF3168 domain-containing protein n=1 Tax=Xanthobacter sp. TaxID=35809 RepID=UPI0025F14F6B|nr:DUF3168 domain-containing protein [Xanthobacter sp.]
MTDPILEVQAAAAALLRASSTLAEIVGERVFLTVPEDAAMPYVSFGPADAVGDDAECIDGLEITFQIDAWSRSGGGSEAKRAGHAARKALHQTELALSENAAVLCEHRTTRVIPDPDGKTVHVALTFRAIVEVP